ncbi:BQ2448_5251 [Microbotryum intermedium]|uniref:Small ribosomal subunit protein uS5m n=1 Tax=Microbotryum intermedium TaxID=269621 RepID=A0A238F0I0_9BASI|nr:BQ2448_5251 [Microbotryum intermedium]
MQSLSWLRPLVRTAATSTSTSSARIATAAASRPLSSSACSCQQTESSSTSSSASSSSSSSDVTAQTQPQPKPELRFDLGRPNLRLLQLMDRAALSSFDPMLDIHPAKKLFIPKSESGDPADLSIIFHNDDPTHEGYQQPKPKPEHLTSTPGEDDSVAHLSSVTQLSPFEIRNLYRFPLITKRVVNMKAKGKMPAMYSLVVVGNGKGLVGVGEGKDDTANKAVGKAFSQAVRSMDYVERYEERTIWGTMQSNFGSCQIHMRPRAPGFGLRVNHYIHQVAKAAGISDLSAKVHGSRNGTRVIKLAVAMLHGGTTPVDMGGFGQTKGQRKNKKTRGMATADEVAKLRGRKAVVF